jgi:hypothetical protein
MMQTFRHFFGVGVIAPSPNKTNKFVPYHLIITKGKCYVIKLYTFYEFCSALYSVKLEFSVTFEHLHLREMFLGDTESSQFFNQ